MVAQRKPDDFEPEEPTLRLFEPNREVSADMGDGCPARGVLIGLTIAVVGFWLPLAGVVAKLCNVA